MNRSICFTVDGKPVPKARPRFARTAKGVRTYTPKETTEYEKQVKQAFLDKLEDQKIEQWPLDWEYKLDVQIYLPVPKSYPQWRRALIVERRVKPTTKPDWDNYGKIVSDALNEVAWQDDGHIYQATVRKEFSFREPFMVVNIEARRDIEDRWAHEEFRYKEVKI